MSTSKEKADRAAEQLDALLKEALRAAVAEEHKDLGARVVQARMVSDLVGAIEALERAKQKNYLVDPLGTVGDVADELGQKAGQ